MPLSNEMLIDAVPELPLMSNGASIASSNCSSPFLFASAKMSTIKIGHKPDCQRNKNRFCFVCARFLKSQQSRLFFPHKKQYETAFGTSLDDSNLREWFVPNHICDTCRLAIYSGKENLRKQPAIWNKPANPEDCLFCKTEVRSGKLKTLVPMENSVIRPQAPSATNISENLPVDSPQITSGQCSFKKSSKRRFEIPPLWTEDKSYRLEKDEDYVPPGKKIKKEPQPWNEAKAFDFIKNARLPKSTGEIFLSQMKQDGLIQKDVRMTKMRTASDEYKRFISYDEESEFAICTGYKQLLAEFIPYKKKEWRLFLDANKKMLIVCLIHNGNKMATFPLAVSRNTKETYERIKKVLQTLNYEESQWLVIGDFKMIAILRGLQLGRPKHMCPFCLFDTVEKNIEEKYCKTYDPREEDTQGN